MYFKGQELNDTDQILLRVPAGERDQVVVDFQPSTDPADEGLLVGTFNVTLLDR